MRDSSSVSRSVSRSLSSSTVIAGLLAASCGLTTNITINGGSVDGGPSGGSSGSSSGASPGNDSGSGGDSGSSGGGSGSSSGASVDASTNDSGGSSGGEQDDGGDAAADSGTDDTGAVDAGGPEEDASGPVDSGHAHDAGAVVDSGGSAHDASDASGSSLFGPGAFTCARATPVPLDSPQFTLELSGDTTGAPHTIDAPCAASGAEVFYQLSFSRPVFLYADTFGASDGTVLYLLDDSCTPLTMPTTPGDSVCSTGACGTGQSQVVARLDPGDYELAVGGVGSAEGPSTVHLQWALSASGALRELAKGSSMQQGNTTGSSGNIEGLGAGCTAAAPEDGFWWTSCPSDPAGTLQASLCGGATFETVLEVQVPGSIPYACSVDSCGLQSSLTAKIPAGAGLRVLSVDGQDGSDQGPYALSVSRP
jgi:hypothetical protein